MSVKCSSISDFQKHDSGGMTVISVREFRTAHVWDKLLVSLVSFVECSVIHA
jgi:hypothetical protein